MDFLAIGEGWESVNIQEELFDATGGFIAGDFAPEPIPATAAFSASGGFFGGLPDAVETPVVVAFPATGGGVASGITSVPAGGLFTFTGGCVIGGDALSQYEEFIASGGAIAGGAIESYKGGTVTPVGGGLVGGDSEFSIEGFFEMFGGGIISGVNWPAADPPDGRIDDDSGPVRGRYRRSRPSGSVR